MPTTGDDFNKGSSANRGKRPTVVAKRAVGCQVDVLLRTVRDEIILRKKRVGLDLVRRLKTRRPDKHRERRISEENVRERRRWHQ